MYLLVSVVCSCGVVIKEGERIVNAQIYCGWNIVYMSASISLSVCSVKDERYCGRNVKIVFFFPPGDSKEKGP